MPISVKPFSLRDLIQAFHGFDIEVESSSVGRGQRMWSMYVKETGFRLRGSHGEIMAALEAYQAGYLAGRKWTGREEQGLRDLISEVESKFKGGANAKTA